MPTAMFDGPGAVPIEHGPDPAPGPAASLVRVHRAPGRVTDLETARRPTIGKPILLPAPGREAA